MKQTCWYYDTSCLAKLLLQITKTPDGFFPVAIDSCLGWCVASAIVVMGYKGISGIQKPLLK
ncbi:MAG: hypothetical protein HFH68_17625 [Lachnospiraceae bacterium]|nr:hypothetical protein [Lachnospiraceae bacterium]